MNVIGVGWDRKRPEIKRRGHTARHGEAGSEIVMRRLRIERAVEVVFFHPRHVDREKQRRGEKRDRDKTDDGPNFAVSFENGLA